MQDFTPKEVLSDPISPALKEELRHWRIVSANRTDAKIRTEAPNK